MCPTFGLRHIVIGGPSADKTYRRQCFYSRPLGFGKKTKDQQWINNKDTILFLGVWERINNPHFNSPEFEGIRNEAGRNSFQVLLSPTAKAKGMVETIDALWKISK